MQSAPARAHDRPVTADLVARGQGVVSTEVLPVEDRFDGDVTAAGGDNLRGEMQQSALDVACAALDAGSSAAQETSIAKAFGGEAIGRVVDRSMQLCGGLGMSADLPVARIAREVRPFRVYDGPSEVHRFAIAKRAVKAARLRTSS
jgi:hypothetical protein